MKTRIYMLVLSCFLACSCGGDSGGASSGPAPSSGPGAVYLTYQITGTVTYGTVTYITDRNPDTEEPLRTNVAYEITPNRFYYKFAFYVPTSPTHQTGMGYYFITNLDNVAGRDNHYTLTLDATGPATLVSDALGEINVLPVNFSEFNR